MGADDDGVGAVGQSLGMDGGIATTHTDGELLGDVFGDGHEIGHRREGSAEVVHVQPGGHDALAHVRQSITNLHDSLIEELDFVDSHDFGLVVHTS